MDASFLIPDYSTDVWLTRVKNNRDYILIGFIGLLFIALFFGFLASLTSASSTFSNFGIIGFFMFIFSLVIAGLTLVQEQLGVTMGGGIFGLVLYGKTTTLKGLAVDLSLGLLIGCLFALPNLLPLSTAQLSIANSGLSPLEEIFVSTLLFAVIEEFWRASTFEPFIGNFLKGGAEFPILLAFFGVVSFFIPTFLSVPILGLGLILLAVIIAFLQQFGPFRVTLTQSRFVRHSVIITIGVISWTLFHVFTASSYVNPYMLYGSALAFGFIVDAVNAVRQSAMPSYTAHVTNNAIVTSLALGYGLYPGLFVLSLFLMFFILPMALTGKGRR